MDLMAMLRTAEMRRATLEAKMPTDPRERLIAECKIAALAEIQAVLTSANSSLAFDLTLAMSGAK